MAQHETLQHEIEYSTLVADLRKSFQSGVTKTFDARKKQLKQLHLMLEEHEDEIYEAVHKDLHKCKLETNLMEILQVRIDLANAVNKLSKWMKNKSVQADLMNKLNKCELRRESLGVVLIISPWNYPILLNLMPIIGAISAGNCIVLKPSEMSPHISALLGKLLNEYLSPDVVQVVYGGVAETTALLRERFDLVFYTGATSVGKIVMRAAAEHLTPVVLELGGKCPAVIDDTCNMEVIAQRITWGKFVNCGQTCLAPDYVLCVGNCEGRFIESMKTAITKFYGENVKESDSYGRIINKKHFQRIFKLIDESKVVFGNDTDEDDLYISPTIMKNVTAEDAIMQDEIFGPVLPIISVESAQHAIDFINEREKPLAAYVFSTNYKFTQNFSNATSSGSICVNDTLCQAAVPTIPFGGVGFSGMGRYHGKSSFLTFSNVKGYLYKSQGLESVNTLRYPPYNEEKKILKMAQWAITPKVKQ